MIAILARLAALVLLVAIAIGLAVLGERTIEKTKT